MREEEEAAFFTPSAARALSESSENGGNVVCKM